MAWLNELGRRLMMLLRRERFDRDLEEEIRLRRWKNTEGHGNWVSTCLESESRRTVRTSGN